MKNRLLQASFLISLLFFTSAGYAFPIINNIFVQEPALWLGETETIFLNCTDDNSGALALPYADITTESALFPNNPFTADSNGNYYLAIPTSPSSNFYKTGVFNATVFCKNELGESANASVSFTVSNLSIEINKLASPAYIGDIEEADVFVKKDSEVVTSDINFSVSLNGANIGLLSQPYYDFVNGWVLKFPTAGQTAGTKTLSIGANYDGASVFASPQVIFSNPIEYSFLGVDKTWVSANDVITVQLKAIERGAAVQIKKEYLTILMGSTAASINEITLAAGGIYSVRFNAPSMPAGTHTLKVTFNYNNFSESYSKSISYTIQLSGNIFLANEKSAQAQLKFISGDTNVAVKPDSIGAYSALLPPGSYTIQLADGTSILEVLGANINNFDDGLKYQPITSGTVAGIQGAGIYYYGAALDYSSARLKLPYDQSKVNDESALSAYVCESWNSGKKSCAVDWKTVDSKIDTVRKIANIDSAELNAAYIIGSPDSASVEASAEKDTYSLNEKIKITGIALDGAKNTLPEASITASLSGLPIVSSVKSNAQGVFSLELDNPGSEGTYSATISVSKTPYISSQKQVTFTVVKTSDLTIMGPDTIRMSPGDVTDVQFRLINVGEADLSDLKLLIKGLPTNYYRIIPSDIVAAVKAGAEQSITLHFEIPEDAAKATFGATIEASKDDFARMQSFALSVMPAANSSSIIITQAQSPFNETSANTTESAFSLGMPTALATFFEAQNDTSYILGFAAVSFSLALLLRKKRINSRKYSVNAQGKKSVHRNMIFEIKNKISESERARERNAKERRLSKYSKKW